jgi:hypothetical protein
MFHIALFVVLCVVAGASDVRVLTSDNFDTEVGNVFTTDLALYLLNLCLSL